MPVPIPYPCQGTGFSRLRPTAIFWNTYFPLHHEVWCTIYLKTRFTSAPQFWQLTWTFYLGHDFCLCVRRLHLSCICQRRWTFHGCIRTAQHYAERQTPRQNLINTVYYEWHCGKQIDWRSKIKTPEKSLKIYWERNLHHGMSIQHITTNLLKHFYRLESCGMATLAQLVQCSPESSSKVKKSNLFVTSM